MRILRFLFSAFALLAASHPASAGPAIPNFWGDRENPARPDLSAHERVRFLTTIDFAPFNFLDGRGRLTGFHVDLARAICSELNIQDRCQIQALPWEELDDAMAQGEGEALIAGKAVSRENRELYAFTRPFLQFPARFAMRRDDAEAADITWEQMDGKWIGVLAGSAHEEMLRSYFPGVRVAGFSEPAFLHRALREENVDAIFGDGMRMALWLGSGEAQACCDFAGGPYLAPEFLGQGLAIAVLQEDAVLAEAFDQALRELSTKGVFAELYLRYFPVSFY